MKLKEHQQLYVRSMGKMLRVTAFYTAVDDANRHMERPGNTDAVVAEFGQLILLADIGDRGLTVNR